MSTAAFLSLSSVRIGEEDHECQAYPVYTVLSKCTIRVNMQHGHPCMLLFLAMAVSQPAAGTESRHRKQWEQD